MTKMLKNSILLLSVSTILSPIVVLSILTNQISCCKGKWYVRRFHPDKVENGHIYSSVKEEKYSYIGFTSTVSVG